MKKKTIKKLRKYAIIGSKKIESEILEEFRELGGVGFGSLENDESKKYYYHVSDDNMIVMPAKLDRVGVFDKEKKVIVIFERYLKIKAELIAKEERKKESKKELKLKIEEYMYRTGTSPENRKNEISRFYECIKGFEKWIKENENKKDSEIAPKNGEVWRFTYNDKTHIDARVQGDWLDEINENKAYSLIGAISGRFKLNRSFGLHGFVRKEKINDSNHAKKEHANGYHWDGTDLIKIPEYVKWGDNTIKLNFNRSIFNDRFLFETNKNGCYASPIYAIDNPSTKEAFEEQEANKNIVSLTRESYDSMNRTIDEQIKTIQKLEETKEDILLNTHHWYEDILGTWLVLESYPNMVKCVGFDNDGNWKKEYTISGLHSMELADTREVKKLLFSEADKQGFKESARHTGVCGIEENGNNPYIVCKVYINVDGWLMGGDTGCVFDHETGKWAEIIKPLYSNKYGDFYTGDEMIWIIKEDLSFEKRTIGNVNYAFGGNSRTSPTFKTKKQGYQWITDNIKELR